MAAKTLKPKPKNEAPPLRGPNKRELEAGQEAARRLAGRRKRPEAGPFEPGGSAIQPNHNDQAVWDAHLDDAFGSTSPDFVLRSLSQLSTAMQRKGTDPHQGLNAGLAVLGGLQPENEIEAMLGIQMAATHEAALDMLASARGNGSILTLQTCGNLAVKLLRTYTVQAEALAKMRRGGEQTVRVEHVHVHPGAQAVVGNVQQGPLPSQGGGVPQQTGDQPHGPVDPKALAFTPVSPLWSEEPVREPVPVARREE